MLPIVLKTSLPARSCDLGVTSIRTVLNVSGAYIEYVSKNNKIVIVEWEKKMMASDCCGTEPKVKVQRWPKTSFKYIEVSCPSVVKIYHKCMVCVDICDQQMER
ncbi:hypothetical protein NPIL_517941 [Nephila pilipes]|uniref:Uncharacterized protein n=1 Tax=Nephila pilipes TaxID=299642 RepID=A0A8X6MKX1_NEPPI|nr:hypothetical protein NPIL_517941 [Nephila pilipes]